MGKGRSFVGAVVTVAALLVVASALTGCEPPPPPSLAAPCGRTSAPPTKYNHVVVILEENRTWSGGRTPAVGLGFSSTKMPFLHGLASKCSYYKDWAETNSAQNSLNQYIGITSGVANTHTVNDCTPSATCSSVHNNIFRQVRESGRSARSFVDGATEPCSAGTNAAKHIPALYYWGGTDQDFCPGEVRPMSQFDPDKLPTYAFLTPDLCHDGHDCSDTVVDNYAKQILTPILNGASYKAGKTLILVTYDEDRPVPNLIIAPTAHAGIIQHTVGSHAAALKTIEQILGLPVMNQGQLPTAISLRSSAHI